MHLDASAAALRILAYVVRKSRTCATRDEHALLWRRHKLCACIPKACVVISSGALYAPA